MPDLRREQLSRHAAALGRLSRRGIWHAGDRLRAFRELTEVSARTLGIARVGIWLYDADRSVIECQDLFESGSGEHSAGEVLARRDFPAYFAALEQERAIAADDAHRHPSTREFADSYLAPLGIASMLDAPIMTEGECVGVVCHEHVGHVRKWTLEEQSFAGSMADFAALAVKTEQRRRAETSLRQREEELRLALESAAMGTWSWDARANRIRWSERVGELFGRERGWHPTDIAAYLELIHPQDRDGVVKALVSTLEGPGDAYFVRHRVVWPDGSLHWLEVRGHVYQSEDGTPAQLRGTITDYTERYELEVQLFQAQKMEGIGRLAGGVAHDFNNLLTVIQGYTQLLLEQPLEPEGRECVETINHAADRAADLTSQLLAFARRQTINPRVIDLGEQLDDVSRLLVRLIGENVKLEVVPAAGTLPVRADPSQIEQVVVNLAVNARDAMAGGGLLELRTSRLRLEREEGGLPPGDYACLSVSDNGEGIPPDVVPHVFEPFFTTKEIGHGTGLGLSTCYGIVQQAGGRIRVRSRLGRGTTFDVILPLLTELVEEAVEPPRRPATPGGRETVLLIEDERLVRRLFSETLRSAGYDVVEAADGDEALERASRPGTRVDVIVTDVVIPGRSGAELLESLLARHPGAATLFVSGYAEDTVAAHGVASGDVHFLAKPFAPRALTEKVRELLDHRDHRGRS